jgi:hypothetical protein
MRFTIVIAAAALGALLIFGCAWLRKYEPPKTQRSIFTGEKVKLPPKPMVD